MIAKIQDKIRKLPDSPGVYFFLSNKRKILYIGKATSLRSRVRSYFTSDIGDKRGPLIQKMMSEKLDIKFEKTDSVLEALLLEAELIRKHLPPNNIKGKDQKSWNYVVVTQEKFPRVLIMRGKDLESNNIIEISDSFGPFPSAKELKIALKIVRKIFPYRDYCEPNQGKSCFNSLLGLCPGVCTGMISEKEYQRTIKNIKLFFQGKKKILIKSLEKDMKDFAREKMFEDADRIKQQIFALNHINDIALIRERSENVGPKGFRIEAYDISHTSGTNMVGVMTVVENGEARNSEYRMFKIRGQSGSDDTRALGEVLGRRLRHNEWQSPDLIVMDGGSAQLNIAKLKIRNYKFEIPIVSVVKDDKHRPKDVLGDQNFAKKYKKEILLANSESHRFAIAFHRKRLRNRM